MSARLTQTEPLGIGFTVVVDQREKHPWRFIGVKGDGVQKGWDLYVPLEIATLRTGDYQIKGDEGFAIERKSLSDFVGTVARNRDRFTRALERLQAMDSAHVIVEAEWSKIFGRAEEHTRMPRKAIYRSVLAWNVRFNNVHWHFCPGRAVAEKTALQLMRLYQKHRRL